MNGSVNLSSPWMNGMNGSVQCKFSVDGWNECNCKISVLKWMNQMYGSVQCKFSVDEWNEWNCKM